MQLPKADFGSPKPSRTRTSLTSEAGQRPVRALSTDASVLSLLAANLLTLGIAWHLGDDAGFSMQVYWLQSVIIGFSYCARILSLKRFSTENFTSNGRPLEPTRETQISTAGFFVVHYGFFHAGYLHFMSTDVTLTSPTDPWLLWAVGAFAVNHWFSVRHNRELDARGTPNIGTMMFVPYIRIVPMHLAFACAVSLKSSAGLVLFGLLKTAADVTMHLVEHRILGSKPS